jgi:hypothetical protein
MGAYESPDDRGIHFGGAACKGCPSGFLQVLQCT